MPDQPIAPPAPLTDPRALRAYAHPVRMALVGLLRVEGPLTATRAAAVLGESVASCSFHLRQMAKYGLVEPAPGGRGREKPWRATAMSTAWEPASGDPAGAQAVRALNLAAARMYHEVTVKWLEASPDESEDWRRAAQFGDDLLDATAEELLALRAQIDALISPYRRGGNGPGAHHRPPDARPVLMLRVAFPVDGTAARPDPAGRDQGRP
jgi:Helix-turn-helix domain